MPSIANGAIDFGVKLLVLKIVIRASYCGEEASTVVYLNRQGGDVFA